MAVDSPGVMSDSWGRLLWGDWLTGGFQTPGGIDLPGGFRLRGNWLALVSNTSLDRLFKGKTEYKNIHSVVMKNYDTKQV